jgi:hypothetical protein
MKRIKVDVVEKTFSLTAQWPSEAGLPDFSFCNVPKTVKIYQAFFDANENIFVFKTRWAIRGFVNFYSAGLWRTRSQEPILRLQVTTPAL